jgi:ABC-2 type transport system permease protein
MIVTLVRKLLRDVRLSLLLVGLVLFLFQCLWAKITARIVGEIAPYFSLLASRQGESLQDFLKVIFSGPGKVIQTLAGGEHIEFDRAMDVLSIGYVHPLMQTLFCIWAIGRATGAIAGEIDRGTMELLLAQPLARSRLVLAHLCVDLLTIPVLCLFLWSGNWLGAWLVGPITPRVIELPDLLLAFKTNPDPARLQTHPAAFGPALLAVAALMFAVSGYTMWLSALGRFRWRVLGSAVFLTLIQFLINLVGQMWEEVFGWLRPFTVFYYFQAQPIVLGRGGNVDLSVWNHGQPLIQLPGALVLLAVGVLGYSLTLWTLSRRDLPAPL